MGTLCTVMLVTNIPTPYRIPLFEELSRQLRAEGLRLFVVFGAMGYAHRKWDAALGGVGFEYEVLGSPMVPFMPAARTVFTYSGLMGVIRRECPRVIVTNAFSLASVRLAVRSMFGAMPPVIVWSGAVDFEGVDDSWPRLALRRFIVSRARGFIVYGTRAREYLIGLGARAQDVEIGINTVDTDFFRIETARLREAGRASKGHPVLLYIGDIRSLKNPLALVRVLGELHQRGVRAELVMVGQGEMEREVRGLAGGMGLLDFVRLEGYRQRPLIPGYLAEADVLLFPSTGDVWGLVLVEAMAAGVPCVSSFHAGAVRDLIVEGETGYSVDFDNTKEAADKVLAIIGDPVRAARMGQAAARLIEGRVNLGVSASGFVRAIMRVL